MTEEDLAAWDDQPDAVGPRIVRRLIAEIRRRGDRSTAGGRASIMTEEQKRTWADLVARSQPDLHTITIGVPCPVVIAVNAELEALRWQVAELEEERDRQFEMRT